LSTTNPIWADWVSNPGRLGGKPATGRLSYGTLVPFSPKVFQLSLYASHLPLHVTWSFQLTRLVLFTVRVIILHYESELSSSALFA
jgi:hypothetical protein